VVTAGANASGQATGNNAGGPITGNQVVPSSWQTSPPSGPFIVAGDRLLRSWSSQHADAAVWRCTSTPSGGGCGEGLEGEAGVTSTDSGGLTIDLLVPADTAVAALSIDGEPVAWQRPRGRPVLFSTPMGVQRWTVTAYDGAGTVIAEYSS
jgi:hypothetical protein